MRLGLQLGYDDPVLWTALAEEAERCGFHSVWTSEAYGSDAVSPLAWIGSRTTNVRLGTAIMQMPARSPATSGRRKCSFWSSVPNRWRISAFPASGAWHPNTSWAYAERPISSLRHA